MKLTLGWRDLFGEQLDVIQLLVQLFGGHKGLGLKQPLKKSPTVRPVSKPNQGRCQCVAVHKVLRYIGTFTQTTLHMLLLSVSFYQEQLLFCCGHLRIK